MAEATCSTLALYNAVGAVVYAASTPCDKSEAKEAAKRIFEEQKELRNAKFGRLRFFDLKNNWEYNYSPVVIETIIIE